MTETEQNKTIILFEAQKDGCFHTIEYWTCK